jgi:hypothetical protein
MQTKLSILRGHIAAGRTRDALKLAASWGRRGLGGGGHAEDITAGWAAINNPAFYREIGKDPDALVAAGIQAIKERYGS